MGIKKLMKQKKKVKKFKYKGKEHLYLPDDELIPYVLERTKDPEFQQALMERAMKVEAEEGFMPGVQGPMIPPGFETELEGAVPSLPGQVMAPAIPGSPMMPPAMGGTQPPVTMGYVPPDMQELPERRPDTAERLQQTGMLDGGGMGGGGGMSGMGGMSQMPMPRGMPQGGGGVWDRFEELFPPPSKKRTLLDIISLFVPGWGPVRHKGRARRERHGMQAADIESRERTRRFEHTTPSGYERERLGQFERKIENEEAKYLAGAPKRAIALAKDKALTVESQTRRLKRLQEMGRDAELHPIKVEIEEANRNIKRLDQELKEAEHERKMGIIKGVIPAADAEKAKVIAEGMMAGTISEKDAKKYDPALFPHVQKLHARMVPLQYTYKNKLTKVISKVEGWQASGMDETEIAAKADVEFGKVAQQAKKDKFDAVVSVWIGKLKETI